MEFFLNPEKILDQLDLHSNMVAADFGCGAGNFSVPLAKRLEKGLVYALDVQTASLSALKGRCLAENINNIKVVRVDLEKPKGSSLQDSLLDLVLVVNILFQSEQKNAIIGEAKRVLKRRGKLVVIDWIPGKARGIMEGAIAPDAVKKMAQEAGLKFEKEFDAGEFHYCLVFTKV